VESRISGFRAFPLENSSLYIFRTWKQQKITMSLLCLLLQKDVPIPSLCIQTFVDFLIHDNIELRKVCLEIVIIKFFSIRFL